MYLFRVESRVFIGLLSPNLYDSIASFFFFFFRKRQDTLNQKSFMFAYKK